MKKPKCTTTFAKHYSTIAEKRRPSCEKNHFRPILSESLCPSVKGSEGRGLVAMCGRFTQKFTWHEVRELYELTGAARNLQTHYNIAPTDTVEVVRLGDGDAAELVPMRWGLVPYWWKKPLKQVPATFNARAETVASAPMFRDAFKRHRCVVPASGYSSGASGRTASSRISSARRMVGC